MLLDYSIAGNIDKIKCTNKKIILSCGTEDPFYMINVNFNDACKRNSIDIRFFKSTGDHTSAYWASAIGDHFDFFQKLAKDVE